MDAETQLLLLCARAHMDPGTAGRVAQLCTPALDWKRLYRTADAHGVLALLHTSLRSAGTKGVPAEALERLRSGFEVIARQNLFMTGELVNLLEQLANRGIIAVPFKGPVLALTAYGDLSLRQFGDLDIFVEYQDLAGVNDVLLDCGYHPDNTHELSWERSYTNAATRMQVDVHWAFTPTGVENYSAAFAFDSASARQRLQPLVIAGRTIGIFAPQDMLLIRCQNAAKDYFRSSWPQLGWICDIAELIRANPDLDWFGLLDEAGAVGSRRVLATCVLLADATLALALPDTLLKELERDPHARALAAKARLRLLENLRAPGRDAKDLNLFARFGFNFRARERWRDKLPYLAHFTPRMIRRVVTPGEADQAALPLPRVMAPLHYLLRPFRLAARYLGRARGSGRR